MSDVVTGIHTRATMDVIYPIGVRLSFGFHTVPSWGPVGGRRCRSRNHSSVFLPCSEGTTYPHQEKTRTNCKYRYVCMCVPFPQLGTEQTQPTRSRYTHTLTPTPHYTHSNITNFQRPRLVSSPLEVLLKQPNPITLLPTRHKFHSQCQ